MSDLGDRRRQFSMALGRFLSWLTDWCHANGYAYALDRLKCCTACAKPTSLHLLGLAVDVHIYRWTGEGWHYCASAEEWPNEVGLMWEELGGSWGGRFTGPSAGDENHLSFAWEGRR